MTAWPFGDLPRKHFGAIVVDPPWHFRARTALQMSNWKSRRDAVEQYCAGPYLELFSREWRPRWTQWGDEVGKFGDANK